MKNSEKLFKNCGYEKTERYAGEEFVDPVSQLKIYMHNTGLIAINRNENMIELVPEEVEAMYKYCKEKKWLK